VNTCFENFPKTFFYVHINAGPDVLYRNDFFGTILYEMAGVKILKLGVDDQKNFFCFKF